MNRFSKAELLAFLDEALPDDVAFTEIALQYYDSQCERDAAWPDALSLMLQAVEKRPGVFPVVVYSWDMTTRQIGITLKA